MSRPTVIGVLQVLDRDGWVERREDPADGRKVRLRLTESGRRRLPRVMNDHFARVIAAFAGSARAITRRYLTQISDELTTIRPWLMTADPLSLR